MFSRQTTSGIRQRFLTIPLILGLVACCVSPTARAEGLKDACGSLQWAPEDAAFFSAMLRCGEQIDAVSKSRAWARIQQMPAVRDAFGQFEEESKIEGSPAAQAKAYLENPQMAEMLAFLSDLFGQEAFVFGDKKYIDLVTLFGEVSTEMRRMQMLAITEGGGDLDDLEVKQQQMLLSLGVRNLDRMVIPSTVVGFKLEDTERAQRQLDNLAGVLTMFSMLIPQLNGRFERSQIEGNEFLLLKFDGEMVPWEQIPLDELEDIEANEGDAKKLIEKIKNLELVVALGIRDDYFLVSTGPTTDALTNLGKGKSLLERPELVPLAPFAGKRLTSISYMSESLNAFVSDPSRNFDQMFSALEIGLMESELDEEARAELLKDARELIGQVEEAMPRAGATSSVSFLTESGLEGYSYSWGDNIDIDSSGPLKLLPHLGGNPILALVLRRPISIEEYDLVVSWFHRARKHFDTLVIPDIDASDREEYEQFVQQIGPLLKRAHKINRTLLLPSLANGEIALVLDSKIKSRQPILTEDAFENPMPMPEPAVLLSLTDAKKFRKACDQYASLLDDLVIAIRDLDPGSIPEGYTIPRPTTKKTKAGTIYTWPVPEEWGVDKQFAPSAAISDRMAILGSSPKHVRRLLAEKALATEGLLSDTEKPRGSAILLDVAGLLEVLRPWADTAARMAIAEQGLSDKKDVLEQMHTILDVLQCLRTATSEAYFEDGVLVQHSRIVIRDVAE